MTGRVRCAAKWIETYILVVPRCRSAGCHSVPNCLGIQKKIARQPEKARLAKRNYGCAGIRVRTSYTCMQVPCSGGVSGNRGNPPAYAPACVKFSVVKNLVQINFRTPLLYENLSPQNFMYSMQCTWALGWAEVSSRKRDGYSQLPWNIAGSVRATYL